MPGNCFVSGGWQRAQGMPLRNGVVTDRLATMQTAEEPVHEASGLLSLQSASGFCSCQKPGCFSFNSTCEPHVVILCDCNDWSVASVCHGYCHLVLILPWAILLSCCVPIVPCSWITDKQSAVVFFLAREGQTPIQRFHCRREGRAAAAVSRSKPSSRSSSRLSQTNSGECVRAVMHSWGDRRALHFLCPCHLLAYA